MKKSKVTGHIFSQTDTATSPGETTQPYAQIVRKADGSRSIKLMPAAKPPARKTKVANRHPRQRNAPV